jgi:hypothetical protein
MRCVMMRERKREMGMRGGGHILGLCSSCVLRDQTKKNKRSEKIIKRRYRLATPAGDLPLLPIP